MNGTYSYTCHRRVVVKLTQAATDVAFQQVDKSGGVTASAGVDVQAIPNAVDVYFSDTSKGQRHEGIHDIAVGAGHPSGQAASASWVWRYSRQATTSDLPRRHPEFAWTPPPSDFDAADACVDELIGKHSVENGSTGPVKANEAGRRVKGADHSRRYSPYSTVPSRFIGYSDGLPLSPVYEGSEEGTIVARSIKLQRGL